MNTTLLWMLLLPIAGAAAVYYFNRDTDLRFWLGPAAALPGMVVIAITFALSYGSAVLLLPLKGAKARHVRGVVQLQLSLRVFWIRQGSDHDHGVRHVLQNALHRALECRQHGWWLHN